MEEIDVSEAIEIIKDVTWQDNGRHYGKIDKVRNMAIEALKEKQHWKQKCDYCLNPTKLATGILYDENLR